MSAATTLTLNEDTLWRILPGSATKLERDMLRATSSDDFRELFKLISAVKREMEPDSWLPSLLVEYGLAELAKYFKDHRRLLNVGKDLRGKRGTPHSIEEMSRLMRYNQASIWEEPVPTVHFPEFQLELGEYETTLSRLGTLRRLINVVKPVRGRFRRVFHGWDERQHTWDDSEFGDMWDAESGVDILPLGFYGDYRGDDQFIVSLGQDFAKRIVVPAIIIHTDADLQRGFPLSLVENDFFRHHTADFWTILDEDAFDGDLMDRGAISQRGQRAGMGLITQSGDILYEFTYPALRTQECVWPQLDEQSFDGSFDFGGFVSIDSFALASAFELYSDPILIENSYDSQTSGAADNTGEDENSLDGGVQVTFDTVTETT